MRFNGVNDYIEIGHSYPALNLPFSVSAWVYVDPGFTGAAPIFVTNDNAPIYHGFWFAVGATFLQCEFGDGMGGSNPAYRRGKIVSIANVAGRWVHVSAVMKSTTDVDLYLNGINVGGPLSGGSNSTMVSSYTTDKAKIGYFFSNGVTYLFKGAMDEVRLWNRALSQDEVRGGMCKKLTGNEPGLVGYWDFNETSGNIIFDKSATGYNGQFIGNPTREFSGAPIGDRSIYSYNANWAGNSFAIKDGNDSLKVNNITGDPQGIQLYEVIDQPSQMAGLDVTKTNKPYFGVYLAATDDGNHFDVLSCNLYKRDDNSIVNWNRNVTPVRNVLQRGEFIDVVTNIIPFYLGPIRVLCDSTSSTIATGLHNPGLSYKWSTGETSTKIVVHQSGYYKVEVTESCGVFVDSAGVFFVKKPVFTLGADEASCVFVSKVLKPFQDPTGLNFLWQDGSSQPVFRATDFGMYWVTVSNYCGKMTDSIKFTKIPIEIIHLNLGPDKLVCDLPSTVINTGITNSYFAFKWNTGETTPEIRVDHTGIYYVNVIQPCDVSRDTVQVTFLNKPPDFSFGEDEGLCPFKPKVLKPFADGYGLEFSWQDGSKLPTFEARDFGTYWVTVSNACGKAVDTVRYTKGTIPLTQLPNVITSNGDPWNEVFELQDNLIGLTNLLVVNRWGKEVYRASAYKNEWNGNDVDPGVYFIRLTGDCIPETKSPLTIIK
jgi:hypothetical protein